MGAAGAYWPLAAAAHAGIAGLDSDIKGVLVNWPVAFPALQDYAAACIAGGVPQSAAIAASQADFALPIQYPNKLVAIGANYEDHLREMNASIPKSAHPVLFIKPPTTALCGPGKVQITEGCTQFDWRSNSQSLSANATRSGWDFRKDRRSAPSSKRLPRRGAGVHVRPRPAFPSL